MIQLIPAREGIGDLAVLAFGAHADDTDIGCSGTLATLARQGKAVGVCDLTQAELSSNGTVFTRRQEATQAGVAIGLGVRTMLSFPDRGLSVNERSVQAVAAIIRQFRPQMVLAPDFDDRHPDHRACAAIVEEGVMNAGLRRYATDGGRPPHRVRQVLYYSINGMEKPDVALDISAAIEVKRAALASYGSQFDVHSGAVPTPLNQGFIEAIVGRDALTGHQCGCLYAEGFRTKRPFLLSTL